MPHKDYADPITNDGSRLHSNIPVSELTEHVTQAIEASDVSSTPPVAETTDGVTITKMSRPSTGPSLRAGARGKLDSQEDRTCGRRTMAQILGRGYTRKQEMLSPTSSLFSPRTLVTPNPQQRQGVEPHSRANKGIYTPFLK